MIGKWLWILKSLFRQIWVTAALYSLLGVATAFLALWLEPLLPSDLKTKIGAEAVDHILGILASSMLAVTTFSIATMVSAYAAAATGATPRATQLLVEDRTAQTALGTFLGAFLFSIVSIVALATGSYGANGRILLFAVTIVVIVLIVVVLVRWIDKVARLGRVAETIDQVEQAAARAMRLHARPGAFAAPGRPLAFVAGLALPDDDTAASIRGAFTIGDNRSYDQDPRFGLIVLSEIASRALSPAVNDPGTAIDVIGTAVRVLVLLTERHDHEPQYANVRVPPITPDELFDDAFRPIARDGAALVEVAVRLQKAFRSLTAADPRFADAAQRHAREALARSVAAMTLPADRKRVTDAMKGR
jgi:uncharacterized membrane protein